MGTAAASLVHSVCTALGRVTTSQASVSACPASLARCVTKVSLSDLCHTFSTSFQFCILMFRVVYLTLISILSPCTEIL